MFDEILLVTVEIIHMCIVIEEETFLRITFDEILLITVEIIPTGIVIE